MRAADRGFAAVLGMTFPSAEQLEARRTEAFRGFLELIARAKATGHHQADFASGDLVVLLMAKAGVTAATPRPHRQLASTRRTDAARLCHPRRRDPTDAPATILDRALPCHD